MRDLMKELLLVLPLSLLGSHISGQKTERKIKAEVELVDNAGLEYELVEIGEKHLDVWKILIPHFDAY
jgi:hypothetical protein